MMLNGVITIVSETMKALLIQINFLTGMQVVTNLTKY